MVIYMWGNVNTTMYKMTDDGSSIYSSITLSVTSNEVQGVGIDSDGCIWAVGRGGTEKISKLNQSGTEVSSWSRTSDCRGLGVDANDCIWVSGNPGPAGTLYKCNQSGSVISSFAGGNHGVEGIGFDSDGCVWFNMLGTNKVYKSTEAGSLISSWAAPSSDSRGMTLDSDGCIWLNDVGTDKHYKINQAGSIVSSFAMSTDNTFGIAFEVPAPTSEYLDPNSDDGVNQWTAIPT